MKHLKFTRKQILRAIQAALSTAFLTAIPAKAQFKIDQQSPMNQVTVATANGTTNTITGKNTFTGFFEDTGTGTDNITIDSGSTITNNGQIIQFSGGGSVKNKGTLGGTGAYLIPIELGNGNAPLTVTNTGSINAQSSSAYQGAGIVINATGHGPISTTNSGTITAGGDSAAVSIALHGAGGTATVDNSGVLTVQAFTSIPSTGIEASNNGADISVTNSKQVSSSGYTAVGINTSVTGTGDTTIKNSSAILAQTTNSVYGGATVFSLISGSGNISLTNSGSATASAYSAEGMYVSSGGALTIVNSGSISASGKHTGGEAGGGLGLGMNVAAMDNLSVVNSGSLNCSSSGYYGGTLGIDASSSTGSVYVGNSKSITCSNSTAYGGNEGIYAQTAGGAITINNSSSLSVSANSGSSFGIDVQTVGTTGSGAVGTITNTGTIYEDSGYGTLEGIEFDSPLLTANITNGTGGSIQAAGGGIQVQNTIGKDVITNEGSLSSGGIAIQDLGTGNITINQEGGSLSAGNGSDSIQLGTGNNTVNISGTPAITGLMDGGGAAVGNTINFVDVRATSKQQSDFQAISSRAEADPTGTYTVTFGDVTYTFTDFRFVHARFLGR